MHIYIYAYIHIYKPVDPPGSQDFQNFPELPRAAPEPPELSQCSQSSGRALPRLPQALESTPPQDWPFPGHVQSAKLTILVRTARLDFFRNLGPQLPRAPQSSPELPQSSPRAPRALPRLSQALESTPLRIDHFRAMCKVKS